MISAIVTACGREGLLRETLASLVGQQPPGTFEVLVMNASDRHLRSALPSGLIGQVVNLGRQVGQSVAINAGVRLAVGNYLTIVEDDDTVLPQGWATLMAALEAHPEAGAVYSLPQYTDAEGVSIEAPPRLRRYLDAHPTIRWADVQRDGLFIHGTATMYRRSTIAAIGGWDETLETAEEFDAHLRMLHAGIVFQAVDALTVTYRRHPGGKSQNRFRRRTLRRGVMHRIYDRLGLAVAHGEDIA